MLGSLLDQCKTCTLCLMCTDSKKKEKKTTRCESYSNAFTKAGKHDNKGELIWEDILLSEKTHLN